VLGCWTFAHTLISHTAHLFNLLYLLSHQLHAHMHNLPHTTHTFLLPSPIHTILSRRHSLHLPATPTTCYAVVRHIILRTTPFSILCICTCMYHVYLCYIHYLPLLFPLPCVMHRHTIPATHPFRPLLLTPTLHSTTHHLLCPLSCPSPSSLHFLLPPPPPLLMTLFPFVDVLVIID